MTRTGAPSTKSQSYNICLSSIGEINVEQFPRVKPAWVVNLNLAGLVKHACSDRGLQAGVAGDGIIFASPVSDTAWITATRGEVRSWLDALNASGYVQSRLLGEGLCSIAARRLGIFMVIACVDVVPGILIVF